MTEEEMLEVLRQFDVAKGDDKKAIWANQIAHERIMPWLPYFLKFYPKARNYVTRLKFVFAAILFSRNYEDAFQLGLLALEDKATQVRYRACQLLANSYRQEAIPHLEPLLSHPDSKTAEDARFAILSLEHKNHNLFMDRSMSGGITWGRQLSPKERERIFGK